MENVAPRGLAESLSARQEVPGARARSSMERISQPVAPEESFAQSSCAPPSS